MSNLGWLVAEKGVRLALSVVVGFWLARYLGPASLGTLSYCTALVTLAGIIPTLGLEGVIKRDLLQSPDRTRELLASSLALRLGAGVVTYLALLLVALCGWGVTQEESRLLVILGALLLQPALLVPDLWLQTKLLARWSVSVQVVALAICAGLRIWLIVANGTLAQFAAVTAFEMALCAAGVWFASRYNGLALSIAAACWTTTRQLLAEAWPLFFASLAVIVYMRIDEVMLRQMAGPAAVGVYSAAARLSELWYFLPTALASSLLPSLMRARGQSPEAYAARLQQQYDLSAAVSYGLSIPVAFAAPWIVRLAYGEAFQAAGPILVVHIWSSVFVFLGVVRGQWLVNERLPGFYLTATLTGAVANVLLNLLLIPRWAGLGAAYATVLSYALAAWISSYFHPVVRAAARMQTRALLIPFTGWRYFKRP